MIRSSKGFTLIELLIVVTIISIIAAVAIPNLLSSRLNTNEAAAIATLRAIASAQAASQTRSAVDVDADGFGEFLYLGELSGSSDLRGTAVPLDPAAVSVSLGLVNNSSVAKGGYQYAIFLPDGAGAGVAEDPNGGKAAPGAVDADLCETFWVAYAWPGNFGSSGRRTFMVNQSGNILQTSNTVHEYEGIGSPPPADAAFVDAGDITSDMSIGGVPGPAQDGGVWLPVN